MTTRRLPFLGPHGITTRADLLAAGLSPAAIRHRVERGLLHPRFRASTRSAGRRSPGTAARLG